MTTALMVEAVSTSETFDNFYETAQRNIPEASRIYKPPVDSIFLLA
jgi:hypothetical protein